jgi:hypothetical protein
MPGLASHVGNPRWVPADLGGTSSARPLLLIGSVQLSMSKPVAAI